MADTLPAAWHRANGMVVPPTMDPTQQHPAVNPDGSISTVKTIGVNVDGLEVVIPTISPDGQFLTDEEARQLFLRTGRHLGMFKTVDQANAYAQQLHASEAQRIGQVMRPVASHEAPKNLREHAEQYPPK